MANYSFDPIDDAYSIYLVDGEDLIDIIMIFVNGHSFMYFEKDGWIELLEYHVTTLLNY